MKRVLVAVMALGLLVSGAGVRALAHEDTPCQPMAPYMNPKIGGFGGRLFSLGLKVTPKFFGYLRKMTAWYPPAKHDMDCFDKQLVNHILGYKYYKDAGDTYYDGYKIRRRNNPERRN